MLEKIKKNIGIIILIMLVMVILIIYQISGTKNPALPGPSPSPATPAQKFSIPQSGYKLPPYSQPITDSSGQINENSPNVQTAISEKSKLVPGLPIYVEGFQTSSSVTTTLNVYTVPEDPNYLIHIEIYGIRYDDPGILEANNKNAQAFIDSFNKIKSVLSADGVDIHKIYFIFGAKPYIQSAADNLIRKYNLL